MSNRCLRVGIIGAGFITGTAHIPALLALGDRVRIVALADNRPEALAYMAKRFGIAKTYADPLDMLAQNELDLVHVCTANNTHREFAIAALKAGANVLCEKPLALTLRDANAMFDAADKAGRQLFAVQNTRIGGMQAVRQMVQRGWLGDVYFVEMEGIRRRGVPTWGRFHTMRDNGGGPLCDIGVHQIDAALYALGNPRPVAVSANTYRQIAPHGPNNEETLGAMLGDQPYLPRGDYDQRDFSVEDFAAGIVRFEGGLQFMMKFSWAVNMAAHDGWRFCGTAGGLEFSKSSGKEHPITFFTDRDGWFVSEEVHAPMARKGYIKGVGHDRYIEHIADVLQGGAEPMITRAEMLNVVSIMEAFYLSAERKREVEIETLLARE